MEAVSAPTDPEPRPGATIRNHSMAAPLAEATNRLSLTPGDYSLGTHRRLPGCPDFGAGQAHAQHAPGRGPWHGQNLPRICPFVIAGDGGVIEDGRSDQAAARGLGGSVAAVGHTQFAEHIGDVVVDGARTEKEARGNLRISQALAEEGEHFLLAERQPNPCRRLREASNDRGQWFGVPLTRDPELVLLLYGR